METMNIFAGLCDIFDCKNNHDCSCSLGYFYSDACCMRNFEVPARIKEKKYAKIFDPKDCTAITLNSPSKGAQNKWITSDNKFIIKDRFYYQLRYWNDDLVEVLASKIGRQLGLNILEQHLCKLGSKDCSFSENWGNKRFIPYDKLDKANDFIGYSDPTDRVKYIISCLSNAVHRDATDYVKEILTIDFLIGNEDRHTQNFGILVDEYGQVEFSPIFDCGLGLFEHDILYNELSLSDSIKKMQHPTFGDWKKIDSKYFIHEGIYRVESSLLPNRLAKEYLRYSAKQLDMEVIICN